MTFASSVAELEQWLSRPDSRTVESLSRLSGDLMILGAAGKMGPTLARMARRALPPERQVIAVSRFSNGTTRAELEAQGVRCIACDLLDPKQVNALPEAPNVIFMAGQKFGTQDAPELTWMINAIAPSLVARKFHASRIVAFSTGCVYPLRRSRRQVRSKPIRWIRLENMPTRVWPASESFSIFRSRLGPRC